MIFLTIKHAHFQMLVLLNIMHNGVVDKVIHDPHRKSVNFSSRHQSVTVLSRIVFFE